MRIKSVSQLKGGEILGRQIFDDTGRILLHQGVEITPNYIKKLKELDVASIFVDDPLAKDVIIEKTITEKTRQMSKHALKDVVDKYFKEGKTDNRGITNSVNAIIEDVLDNKDVMINVEEMRNSDKNIYSHAVNVCVLASLIGTHMGYNMIKVRDVAMGALLHDIGKTKILADKKLKETFASEKELNKYVNEMHPKIGYDFLGKQNFCTALAKVAVLMHHEKIDGSGYPLKLKGKEINEIGRLVAICNIFDNMIAGSDTEPAKPVYEVLEYLIGMGGYYFDAEMVKKFSSNIAAFPTGTGVMLNTKEKCLVARQNQNMPLRPVIKVMFNKEGQAITEPYEIDLLHELTLFITGTSEF